MKNIIWSNEYDRLQQEVEFLRHEEDYKGLSEEELREEVDFNFECYLEDTRALTNKNVGRIIAIADLGLWDGRVMGYKLLGSKLSEVFYSDCDYATWGTDSYDFVGREIHHDGTNHYTYRVLKEELSDTQVDNFLDKIYNGKATKRDITRYTKSLKNTVEELLFMK